MEGENIFSIPSQVKKNAIKGLELRKEFGRGSTQVGINRGHQLANEDHISLEVIKRMSSYFARHEVDKMAKDFGNDHKPSKGYIAWLLWGGDAGKEWADKTKKSYT